MRSEFYHVEGGLKLTRMRQSEWRRRWGIAGVVEFETQVGAGVDDGWSDGSNFNSGVKLSLGDQVAAGPRDTFMRWTNVTIPGGATIVAAHIEVADNGGSSPPTNVATNLYFEDADDAVAPTSRAEHVADTRTTAFTAMDAMVWTTGILTASPDISAVVQEILDRGSWSSGNAMMALWDDDGSASLEKYILYSYDNSSALAPLLHVEYSA